MVFTASQSDTIDHVGWEGIISSSKYLETVPFRILHVKLYMARSQCMGLNLSVQLGVISSDREYCIPYLQMCLQCTWEAIQYGNAIVQPLCYQIIPISCPRLPSHSNVFHCIVRNISKGFWPEVSIFRYAPNS